MASAPLTPFSVPIVFASLLSALSSAPIILGISSLVGIAWLLYTAVAVYHWFRYSHASWVAIPAIIAHLTVSLALLVYALSGTLP